MIDKTMNNNDTQGYSQIVPFTSTSIRFVNIERGGVRVRSEVSTAHGKCECVPCEIYAANIFGDVILPPVPNLLIMFAELKLLVLKMGLCVISHC